MKETISPLDGRYAPQLAVLLPYFSEAALMRYRVMVEVEYLITLSKEKSFLGVKPFPKTREKKYRDLYLKFDASNFKYKSRYFFSRVLGNGLTPKKDFSFERVIKYSTSTITR